MVATPGGSLAKCGPICLQNHGLSFVIYTQELRTQSNSSRFIVIRSKLRVTSEFNAKSYELSKLLR